MGVLVSIFGNPKPPYITNVIILNTKKFPIINSLTGREMSVDIVKYQVYQQHMVELNKA